MKKNFYASFLLISVPKNKYRQVFTLKKNDLHQRITKIIDLNIQTLIYSIITNFANLSFILYILS